MTSILLILQNYLLHLYQQEYKENMKTIEVELLPHAVDTLKYLPNSEYFALKVSIFKRVFKGAEELDLENSLRHSIEKNGKITLRPFERVVIGTGIKFEVPRGLKLFVDSNEKILISRGLTVLGHYFSSEGELDIILYNGSQFLCDVFINSVIAKGIFISSERIDSFKDKIFINKM